MIVGCLLVARGVPLPLPVAILGPAWRIAGGMDAMRAVRSAVGGAGEGGSAAWGAGKASTPCKGAAGGALRPVAAVAELITYMPAIASEPTRERTKQPLIQK